MAAKKSYPLRINADVLKAMQRWSDDELRSVAGSLCSLFMATAHIRVSCYENSIAHLILFG